MAVWPCRVTSAGAVAWPRYHKFSLLSVAQGGQAAFGMPVSISGDSGDVPERPSCHKPRSGGKFSSRPDRGLLALRAAPEGGWLQPDRGVVAGRLASSEHLCRRQGKTRGNGGKRGSIAGLTQ